MSRGLAAGKRLTTGAGPTLAGVGAGGRALARAWAAAAAVAAAPAGKAQVAAELNSGCPLAMVSASASTSGS